jgi:predicted transposase YbfD/YdcC
MADRSFSLTDCFAHIQDPRLERTKLHLLEDILALTICAVVCGADTFVAVEQFGRAKHDWLKGLLRLSNGIPSHDTIGDVLARIDPQAFEQGFLDWVRGVAELSKGEVVAIDGKHLRRSYDRHSNKAAIKMVGAWAAENHLVLGQVKIDDNANEISTIPKLLAVLDVTGCIVTIDAAGCQRAIAEQIRDQGADYVLSLKDNQEGLHDEVATLFQRLAGRDYRGCDKHQTLDGEHGRIEQRRGYALEIADRGLVDTDGWADLRSVLLVESERSLGEKTTREQRLFISSLGADAQRLMEAVRCHWHIENQMHWVLDVAFSEDASRIRKDHAPENMATVRRMALNLLRQEKSLKVGVANKRLRAGWDEAYLRKIMQQI